MSRAWSPVGVIPYGFPFSKSKSHTDSASFGSSHISNPRSPVYPVREIDTGISPNFVFIIQKNFRLSRESLAVVLRIARELGPWSASAAVATESSEMVRSMPVALYCSHSRLGSALVIRNLCSDNR